MLLLQTYVFDLKGVFTRAISSFNSPRCAIIAHLKVIYTKFRRAIIAQLNKICLWACAHAIVCHSCPGLIKFWGFRVLNKSAKAHSRVSKVCSQILNCEWLICYSCVSSIFYRISTRFSKNFASWHLLFLLLLMFLMFTTFYFWLITSCIPGGF